MRKKILVQSAYDELVLCGLLHQGLEDRMLTEYREGDAVLPSIVQIRVYLHQLRDVKREENRACYAERQINPPHNMLTSAFCK